MEVYKHRVQYYETDKMGIVHHSNYIRWMEEARLDFLARQGWSYARLEAEGIVSPVMSVSCRYKAPTTFEDEIGIAVSVEEFRGVVLKLAYEMRRGDTLVCEGRSEHVFLNREGRFLRLNREYPEFYRLLTELAAGERDGRASVE